MEVVIYFVFAAKVNLRKKKMMHGMTT